MSTKTKMRKALLERLKNSDESFSSVEGRIFRSKKKKRKQQEYSRIKNR